MDQSGVTSVYLTTAWILRGSRPWDPPGQLATSDMKMYKYEILGTSLLSRVNMVIIFMCSCIRCKHGFSCTQQGGVSIRNTSSNKVLILVSSVLKPVPSKEVSRFAPPSSYTHSIQFWIIVVKPRCSLWTIIKNPHVCMFVVLLFVFFGRWCHHLYWQMVTTECLTKEFFFN